MGERQQHQDKLPNFFCSTRFMMALVGFFGCGVIYALRVNLSVAIVCMVNQTAIEERAREKAMAKANVSDYSALLELEKKTATEICVRANGTAVSDRQDGRFVWDKDAQGNILSAFFWGYLFTQILGGWLAQRFGGKKVIAGNVLITTLVTFLTPLGAELDQYILVALRVLMGFAQGSTFPGFHTLWSHWSPPLERSKLTGLTYAGLQVGNVVTMSVSGLLCKYGFGGGWPSVFYVLGFSGIIWLAIWIYYASDKPTTHRKITRAEKEFIVSSLSHEMHGHDEEANKGSVPWFQIAKSLPVWACFVGHFAGDWGAYLMLTCLPSFLNDVLQFEMTSLGLAAIPYIAYFLCINLAAVFADWLLLTKILSTVNTRRLMMVIALISQAVFLVAAGYCTCGQEMIVIALLTIGMGLSGFQYAGFIVSYMEVAPRYAGPIVGVGNTLSCFAGIIAPKLMSAMTPNKTREEWLALFYVTAAILTFGAAFFCIFIKGEVQPWAKVSKEPKATEMVHLEADGDDLKRELKHDDEADRSKVPLV